MIDNCNILYEIQGSFWGAYLLRLTALFNVVRQGLHRCQYLTKVNTVVRSTKLKLLNMYVEHTVVRSTVLYHSEILSYLFILVQIYDI